MPPAAMPAPSCKERTVFATILAQAPVQIKYCVCTSHRPSAGPPGEVLPLWPGWKWLQGHVELTQA
jgi:hypothetical protein